MDSATSQCLLVCVHCDVADDSLPGLYGPETIPAHGGAAILLGNGDGKRVRVSVSGDGLFRWYQAGHFQSFPKARP
ncbi:hypothetical protein MLD38_033489 [Melastoma candidum]|uniref:Uncharacterized protein n=1 Tax=Melastoma candidum TaxID=119954 RepID=A0ACB9M6X5_9MYRT|nr:hypothetical protein MLD38_033489 [Melastoma candidum]